MGDTDKPATPADVEEVVRVGHSVSPSAMVDVLNLPTQTIHRLLATAEELGFLQRDVEDRSYGPGLRFRRLACNTLSTQRIRAERFLIMQILKEAVGETCNLFALDRHGVVYQDRVETRWPLRMQLSVGTLVPFHCIASAKMYLSSLRKDKLGRLSS